MYGIAFTGNRTLQRIEIPGPTPGPGEVVLESKTSGMFGAHEPCRVVVAIGPGLAAMPRSGRGLWLITITTAPIASIAAPAGRK